MRRIELMRARFSYRVLLRLGFMAKEDFVDISRKFFQEVFDEISSVMPREIMVNVPSTRCQWC